MRLSSAQRRYRFSTLARRRPQASRSDLIRAVLIASTPTYSRQQKERSRPPCPPRQQPKKIRGRKICLSRSRAVRGDFMGGRFCPRCEQELRTVTKTFDITDDLKLIEERARQLRTKQKNAIGDMVIATGAENSPPINWPAHCSTSSTAQKPIPASRKNGRRSARLSFAGNPQPALRPSTEKAAATVFHPASRPNRRAPLIRLRATLLTCSRALKRNEQAMRRLQKMEDLPLRAGFPRGAESADAAFDRARRPRRQGARGRADKRRPRRNDGCASGNRRQAERRRSARRAAGRSRSNSRRRGLNALARGAAAGQAGRGAARESE